MKQFLTIMLTLSIFTLSSFAAGLSDYIRAREFALRFANVIGAQGTTYTLGRDNEDPRRLTVVAGSRDAYIGGLGGQRVKLDRGAKVDARGLLIPASALKYLGCTVRDAGKDILATCDGKSYSLQRFAR
ncbi:MAG: hypothetical protein HC933_01525 [Pleurocapsa sp. SU_196_0]|nr:hypothetical protein [Pleurocapsa sp. SU_196_0]